MNDESLEIETTALEASLDESVENGETLALDMPLVDTDVEVSDTEAEAESSNTEEESPKYQELDKQRLELSEEIEKLRAEVERLNARKTEFFAEIKEFSELFGDNALSQIPESVWESASRGVPLAAAYALHEKKLANQRALAEKVNQKNAASSAGAIKGVSESGFYSPSEVRAMSAKDVKKNYNLIIESMKKWN